jgi:HSP20 family protein
MYPDEEDENKNRRKNPFDFFRLDDDFEDIFRQIEKMWERAFKEIPFDNIEPGKSYIHGYSINMGPDGKPKIQEFGNRPQKKVTDGKPSISEEREPVTDIIETEKNVSITVEVPGVEKQDIDLNVTENTLEIAVNNPERKYHKVIELPCNVLPMTSKATYKNGILDVVLERKERKNNSQGFNVNIQ